MEIKFHGHSCFELSEGDTTVLIDPFLKPNNPAAVHTADEVNPTHITITHGHADHMADALPVAKRTGAHCVAVVELAEWLKGHGIEAVSDPNLGGRVEFEWGSIGLVPAWHTSTLPGSEEAPFSAEHGIAIGTAAGVVVELGGKKVYHAGDTCLFSDMKLVADRGEVDVFIVPIGGHYTMDRQDAAVACELVAAKTVLPMHYNTFPAVETDAEAFKADVESRTASKVELPKPGETVSV